MLSMVEIMQVTFVFSKRVDVVFQLCCDADILHKGKSNIQLSLYDGAIRLSGTGATDVVTFKVYAMNYNKNKGGRKNVLYSTLMVDHSKFRAQPKKGILYLPNTMTTISANVSKVNETVRLRQLSLVCTFQIEFSFLRQNRTFCLKSSGMDDKRRPVI